MKHVFLLATSLVFFAPALAKADTKADLAKVEAQLKACLAEPGHDDNMDMKGCSADAMDAADKVLNSVYAQITANLAKKSGDKDADHWNALTLKSLRDSERAWVAYRDANSGLHQVVDEDGTAGGLDYSDTVYEMTKARAQELADLLL